MATIRQFDLMTDSMFAPLRGKAAVTNLAHLLGFVCGGSRTQAISIPRSRQSATVATTCATEVKRLAIPPENQNA